MKTFPKWAFLLALPALSCQEERFSSPNDAQDRISFYLSEPMRTKAADSQALEHTSANLNQPLVSNLGDTLYLHSSSVMSEPLSSVVRKAVGETAACTKAQPMDIAGLENLGQFPIWAWNPRSSQVYIDGEWIYRRKEEWNFADEHYWPTDGGLLDFYALAPVMKSDGSDLLASGPLFSFEEKKMLFSYETPVSPSGRPGHDAEYQPDLIAAIHPGLRMNTDGGKVALDFKHLLSSVRFVLSDVPAGCVESITLRNIAKSGQCQVRVADTPSKGLEVEWSAGAATADFTQEIAVNVVESSGTELQPLDAEDYSTTFQFIPQKFKNTSPARLELRFRHEGEAEARVYSLNLLGEWKAGCTYTYRISTGLLRWHYRINALDDKNADEGAYGGSFVQSVCAYKETDGGLLDTAHWNVFWSLDNGVTWLSAEQTPHPWMTVTPASGCSGKTQPSDMNLRYQDAERRITRTDMRPVHRANMQAAQPKGTAQAPFDLSLHDVYGSPNPSGRTVANCYVVSAPGWYKIPLAYGNALMDGKVNVSAYEAQVTGEYVVPVLPNAYDTGIRSPWIEQDLQACGKQLDDNGACLIWMDKPDLLTVRPGLIRDDTGNLCMVFHVDAADIDQGNAVVAVRDSEGNVVWSWHIWMVDADALYTFLLQSVYQNYQFLSMALGWEDWFLDRYSYQERQCLIKVCAGDAERQFCFHQSNEDEMVELGAFPLYQWGRKDPLLPASHVDEFEFLHLYGERPSRSCEQDGAVRVAESVRHPELYYHAMSGPQNWLTDNDGYFYNIWDNSNAVNVETERAPVKTVYDPCPPGFRLPTNKTFSLYLSSFKVGNFHIGYRYYRNRWKNSTFFMPCPGCVGYYNGLEIYANYGCYWSFFPYGDNSAYIYRNNSYARCKSFHDLAVTAGRIDRNFAIMVRPVAMD